MTRETVTPDEVARAVERCEGAAIVQRTPVDYSNSISRLTDAAVHLKFEHLQRTGSFKTRGAYNKLSQLPAGVSKVVAASAGNHAQGVALAAAEVGLDATIVMPRTAPQAKVDATAGYGAEVRLRGEDFNGAVEHAETIADGADVELVPAFDDPAIVAGQGTLAHELVEQVPDLDTVVVPIGGGGLVGGLGVALAELAPSARVVGVQADDAATAPRSLDKGRLESLEEVDTIADGIATGGLSDLTLGLIREHVDEVVTVDENEIAHGILVLLERSKQLVEGAGAVTVAALLGDDLDVAGETVVPVLSGGNLDMSMLQRILTHELTTRSQRIRLRVLIDDRPGKMAEISGLVAEKGANIRTVDHYRSESWLDVGQAALVFLIETSGRTHADAIARSIREHGYDVERVN